ncbi:MAG: PAS domain S-box protein [Deltaproteobacteria bacterium]|nr:PAS domain S-box protein [Deltaproteobacteria bacterium]
MSVQCVTAATSIRGTDKMGLAPSFLDNFRARLRIPSLTLKLILGMSVIFIVFIGVFTYFDMVTRTKFHYSNHEERAYEISNMVMRSIEYPMLDGEMEVVQAILESLNRLRDVTVANLCDTEGTIKYSGLPANIGGVDSSEATKRALRNSVLVKGLEMLGEKKILQHAMPIRNEKTCHKCHGAEEQILGILSVGINWTPIEQRIAALRDKEITLAAISLVVVGFFLSLFLSKYITRPLSTLTRLADEISRGRPGFEFGRTVKCWEVEKCDKTDCPAHGNTERLCWYVGGTLCHGQPSGKFPEKLDECRKCKVYKMHVGDEMVHLADSFKEMLSKLKVSDEELRRSEAKYRRLFDSDPNPIFILDRQTLSILDANARAESQYGYSKEELLKLSFKDLGYEADAREIMLSFRDVTDHRSIVFSKKQHRRKDGGLFYTSIHVCGARYMKKNALIATTTDVTESVQKETQLIQAGKLATLGEMAAGIAHELNQPLNVMKIGSDFLTEMLKTGKAISDEELNTVAGEIRAQVARASVIIHHMREFARVADVSSYKLDINEPIRDVFKILGQQLRLHQIDLELDLGEDLPPIMADHNKLEQVFINLVTNARDAMEERTSGATRLLRIRSFVDNDDVAVTVSDTGAGISEDIIDRVFEPFFTTKGVGKGTGLGLSISYSIIKDCGGTIRMESEAGLGTKFELRFPAGAGNAQDNP